jgi:hypothetical protein
MKDRIYTVRGFVVPSAGYSGTPGMLLEEIVNPPCPCYEGAFEPSFFPSHVRPVTERKTDISVFTEALRPPRYKRIARIACTQIVSVFGGNAHELLKATYQGRYRPTPVQLRAATIAIAYESPKLTAMAVSSLSGQDFASMLEKAIARSRAPPRLIEHRPNETAPGVSWTGPLRSRDE